MPDLLKRYYSLVTAGVYDPIPCHCGGVFVPSSKEQPNTVICLSCDARKQLGIETMDRIKKIMGE